MEHWFNILFAIKVHFEIYFDVHLNKLSEPHGRPASTNGDFFLAEFCDSRGCHNLHHCVVPLTKLHVSGVSVDVSWHSVQLCNIGCWLFQLLWF